MRKIRYSFEGGSIDISVPVNGEHGKITFSGTANTNDAVEKLISELIWACNLSNNDQKDPNVPFNICLPENNSERTGKDPQ